MQCEDVFRNGTIEHGYVDELNMAMGDLDVVDDNMTN